MQVILLEKIVNLGSLGDVVKVRDRFRPQLPDSEWEGEASHAAEPG